jgi:hypothetical protein
MTSNNGSKGIPGYAEDGMPPALIAQLPERPRNIPPARITPVPQPSPAPAPAPAPSPSDR